MAKLTNEERLARIMERQKKDEAELKKLKAEIRKEAKKERMHRQILIGETVEHLLPKRLDKYDEEEFKVLMNGFADFIGQNEQRIKELL